MSVTGKQKIVLGFDGRSFLDSILKALGDDYEYVYLSPKQRKNFVFRNTAHRLAYWALYEIKRTALHITQCLKADVVIFIFPNRFTFFYTKLANIFKKKVVYYWYGSDVFYLIQKPWRLDKWACRIDKHVAHGAFIIKELTTVGIDAELLYVPPDLSFELARMPMEHAVLLSIPDSRAEFYGYSTMIELIKAFPQTTFYVVRSDSPHRYDYPNVIFKGTLSPTEMEALFDEVSIVVRYPEHDSVSMILTEALAKGKSLISRFNFPYEGARIATDFEELCKALEAALKDPLEPDLKGHEYVKQNFSKERFRQELNRYIKALFDDQSSKR